MENIKNKIIAQIQKGEVAMRPRWHFVLKAVLLVLVALGLALFTIFLLSFMVFAMRSAGVWYMPLFGTHAFMPFLASLPWLLILIVLMFWVVLEVLVQKFSFAYKKPLLYSAFGIVFVTLLGSVLILQTTLHDRFQERAERGGVPVMGSMYRDISQNTPKNIYMGNIVEVTPASLTIDDVRKGEVRMERDQDTRLKGVAELVPDMRVVIFAEEGDGKIFARGIRTVDEKTRPLNKEKMNR